MGNIIAGAGSFLLSLIAGDAFSTIISPTEKIIKALEKMELIELLNEYHLWFVKEYDSEISSCNDDMGLFESKRNELLKSFDKYYLNSEPDISFNREEQFLQESYLILCPDGSISEIGKKYMSVFFQIVLTKRTGDLPMEIQVTINSLSDQINAKFRDQNRRISEAEEKIERLNPDKLDSANLKTYYAGVLESFTEPNKEESADLVGEESDEKAYIDAYIRVGSENKLFLRYLDEWFVQKDHGVILLYGEPGHGKTTLCKKATVEFIRGNLLKDKAKNVLKASLNTGDNPTIIQDGAIKISNALVWGADREGVFSYKDCRGSLLFMDGFDEFIDTARKNIKEIDIVSFIKRIDKIARQYKIHVVVLSRTTAVQKHLENEEISKRSFQLLPITEDQQDAWLERHAEYDDYRETFNNLRNTENMDELLGIPLLFRLIVHNRFDRTSSNIVELYDNLFSHLMDKRDIRDERLDSVRYGLMNLAYKIYCTDTIYAVMMKKELDEAWVFSFYLDIPGIAKNGDQKEYNVGFYHRTFYQYFLAKYICDILLHLENENAKRFIGYFAERELDDEVIQYLHLMTKEIDKEKINSKMGIVMNALVETEGVYNLKRKYEYGTAEKSRIMRATNVYLNVLHIAYALGYVIQIPFKGKLDILCRTYTSCRIGIYSNADKKANLSEANLARADLRGANLSLANLITADLSLANLSFADLSLANLSGANLSGANLSGANLSGANLSGANLSGANLRGAYLSGANLSGVNLNLANLGFVNLIRANLSGANLSLANLFGAFLSLANLSRAKLSEAYLIGADLSGVDLKGADLGGVDLDEADMRGANLSRANLRKVNLSGVDLSGADLRRACLREADLRKADLREASIDTGINMVKSLSRTYIDEKYKELIHKDIKGYDSIIWSDEESQDDRLLY